MNQKMDEETKKKLEQKLNSEYSINGEVVWTILNGIWRVDLYFDSASYLTFSFIEDVNSFLKHNGWMIEEIISDEDLSYYFTLKKYDYYYNIKKHAEKGD